LHSAREQAARRSRPFIEREAGALLEQGDLLLPPLEQPTQRDALARTLVLSLDVLEHVREDAPGVAPIQVRQHGTHEVSLAHIEDEAAQRVDLVLRELHGDALEHGLDGFREILREQIPRLRLGDWTWERLPRVEHVSVTDRLVADAVVIDFRNESFALLDPVDALRTDVVVANVRLSRRAGGGRCARGRRCAGSGRRVPARAGRLFSVACDTDDEHKRECRRDAVCTRVSRHARGSGASEMPAAAWKSRRLAIVRWFRSIVLPEASAWVTDLASRRCTCSFARQLATLGTA